MSLHKCLFIVSSFAMISVFERFGKRPKGLKTESINRSKSKDRGKSENLIENIEFVNRFEGV